MGESLEELFEESRKDLVKDTSELQKDFSEEMLEKVEEKTGVDFVKQ